jgi:predicted methyltransferase
MINAECRYPVTLSAAAALALLAARGRQESHTRVSPDLNLSLADVELGEAVVFADGTAVAWPDVGAIAGDENGCYVCDAGGIAKVQLFSEETQRVYTLYPTSGAPTMLISGIPMHRIKGTDPHQDTLAKIRAAGPLTGRVLDTCTGLGYTALAAAGKGAHVTTVELDPTVHEIIRRNPWSCRLFVTPAITPLLGDVEEVITTFGDASFDAIIHDPPMFSLAGELYSLAFYRELLRVLRRGGRLFHYIGNPESKSGATVTRGAVRRLTEAGFRRVQERAQAFGVVALK